MRIALDATYSVGAQPSGIAVYSRHVLDGLARAYPDDRFAHCYRPKQFRLSGKPAFPNVNRCVLLPLGLGVRADLFHALNQRLDVRYSARMISTFHDLFVMTGEYSSPEFRQRFSKQAREAAARSDLIIAVSEFTAAQISSLLNIERNRIRVIPHGVDPPNAESSRSREPIVLFVGALQIRKNVMRLVQAVETMPEPWRLVLAGAPDGYKADEILDFVARSAARERIEVTGYVSRERLNDLFARASIFAFPSLDEGFGIPVLEAMARGVPVITSNRSALGEVAGGAALLIDPYRVDEIAGALNQLAQHPHQREELAVAGRSRAASFTWGDAVRKTYAVYRELTS